MNKQSLREEYLSRRLELSNEEIEERSLQIANNALELDIWDFSTYHIFLPITSKKELNTEYLLHILQGKDKNVVLSRSNFKECTMQHYLLTDQTKLVINKYGIPEPDASGFLIPEKNIDVVFVPLLIADRFGNRIGYGKGFYDRFLKKCSDKTIKIGLSLFKPLEEELANTEQDIRLNGILSGEGYLKTG